MNSIKFENRISFISDHRKKLDSVCNGLFEDFNPKEPKNVTKIGKFLYTIQYNHLDNWDIRQLLETGYSPNLIALSDKLNHMINKGDACNVKPMLMRMIFKGIKKQTTPARFKGDCGEFLGYGHFRWNHGNCYTLTGEELNQIKTFFGL